MKKPLEVVIAWPGESDFGPNRSLEAIVRIECGFPRNAKIRDGHCIDFNLIFDAMVKSELLEESEKPLDIQSYAEKLCAYIPYSRNLSLRQFYATSDVVECDFFDLEIAMEHLPIFGEDPNYQCWWKAEDGRLVVQGQGRCIQHHGAEAPNKDEMTVFFHFSFNCSDVSPEDWEIFSAKLRCFQKLMKSKLFQNCFQAYGLPVERCSWKAFSLSN